MTILVLPTVGVAQGGGNGSGGNADVLRGRVFDPDGKPIKGAAVTIIGLQSGIVRSTKTDGKGVYTILFASGEGEYVVTVKSLGLASMRKRALRTDGNILVTDFTLDAATNTLDSVKVTAQGDRSRLKRGAGDDHPIGGDETDLMAGKLFSLDPSDYTTLLRGMPGVTYIPGQGYSVLGADPSQNNTLLNGSAFKGGRIPQDALAAASLATHPYDASRGGFSGGQMSLVSRTGGSMHQGTIRMQYNDPRLVWNDPEFPTPAMRSQSWSGNFNGPIKQNTASYFFAFQVDRSVSALQSLLNVTDAMLSQNGLTLDTVQAVSRVLEGIHVPLSTSAVPSSQLNQSQSASLNVKVTPSATTALGINALGSWSRQDGSGISAMTYPSFGTGGHGTNGTLQSSLSTYFGSILNETNASINASSNANVPYLALPGGSVQVTSVYVDGRTGITPISFGGGSSGRSSSSSKVVDLNNATTWLSVDSRHHVKLAEGMNLTRTTSNTVSDPFGRYTYLSLVDLAANRPSSYARTIGSQTTSNTALSSFVSLGDEFKASKQWQFEYGMRADMAWSGTNPAYNPTVDSLFGLRTDRVPNTIGLSPRFGFSWNQFGGREQDMQNMAAQDMLAGRQPRQPITIQGGFGAFRGVIDPGSIAQLASLTGLANTPRQLNCVGAAVPIPNWGQFGADASGVPEQCLDGTAPAVFSTDVPSVQLYDPAYRAPTSWRGNIDIGGLRFKGWDFSVSTNYSLGIDGESQVDLNTRYTPVFTLAGEGGRQMYVPENTIVPATGAIAPGASRISNRFGSVTDRLSDIKSVTKMMSINTQAPKPLFGKVPLNLSYSLSSSRSQFRDLSGFDPLGLAWAAGVQPTHQFSITSDFRLWRFSVGGRVDVNSGVPYTPVVNMDINGDGIGQDRAYVFNPAATADTALARQMSTLIGNADAHVRDCLQHQFGRIAGYNSCRTGWQVLVQPNVQFDFGMRDRSKTTGLFNDRLKFSVQTQNTMSIISRLFGLSNNLLIRSMQYMPLDPTLLYVTGYDTAAKRFKYEVNQQFGDNHRRVRTRSGRVPVAPFLAYLTGELTLGGPPHRTFAQGLGLVATGKEPQPSLDSVRNRLHQLTTNPIKQLLDLKDSLLLTEQQVADLQQRVIRFDADADSLFDPIARYIVAQGKKTSDEELGKRVVKARQKMYKRMIKEIKDIDASLTKEQEQRLPMMFRYILRGKND